MAKGDTVKLCPETDMEKFTKDMREKEKRLWSGSANVQSFWAKEPAQHLHTILVETKFKKVVRTPEERLEVIEEKISKLDTIERDILDIKKDLQELKGKRGEMFFEEIILKDISYKEAKKEITNYFKKNKGKRIYVSDILRDLLIDPELTMRIIDELEGEGVIGERTKS